MIDTIIKSLKQIDTGLELLKIKTDQSNIKLSSTLLVTSIDHGWGITILMEKGCYPPAFALLRSQFETYIRGFWFGKCADEEQVAIFEKKDKIVGKCGHNLNFGELIKEIEKRVEFPKLLSRFKNLTWKELNSFTHSGIQQAYANFDGKTIKSRYSDAQKVKLMYSVFMIASLAYAALFDLTKPNEVSKTINDLQAIEPEIGAFLKGLEK